MSGRIPDSFVEELLARTDIVEVIERRLTMKKAGNELHALCPFHNEKSPSFTISPRKQFYHCFGCGAHGSAIGFLMQYEGLDFRDAVEDLARMAGLQVPDTGPRDDRPREGLYEAMERAATYFQEQLKSHETAIAYLKRRGLTGEICREFGIGYAPAGWDGLLNHFGRQADTEKLLARVGLTSQGEKSVYDKFRDRIMFPIHDRRGRVIGFGGRSIGDDGPKYLNSPETELFHKGHELYGLYLARQRAGKLEALLVVEGYMDVVALAQFGIRNVVATLGTATTSEQTASLLRAADTVVYCFDGDAAGSKAAWRALEATLPRLGEGKQARFLFLPQGEDPDSLVRKLGEAEFRKLIDGASTLSEFFFGHLGEGLDLASIDGRARLVELAKPLIATLPEGVFRDMMSERLASLARHRVAQAAAPRRMAPDPRRRPAPAQQRTPMRLAMAHLVQNPGLAELAGELQDLSGSAIAGMDVFLELVDFCRRRPYMSTAQLLELMHGHPAHSHLVKLAVWPLPGEAEVQALEFQDAVTGLRLQQVEERLSTLPRIIDQDPDQRQEFRDLQQRQKALKGSLQGRVD